MCKRSSASVSQSESQAYTCIHTQEVWHANVCSHCCTWPHILSHLYWSSVRANTQFLLQSHPNPLFSPSPSPVDHIQLNQHVRAHPRHAAGGIRKQGASCLLCLMLPLTVALAGRALLLTRGSLQYMSLQICSQSFRPRVQKVMNSTMLRYSFVTAPPTDYAKFDCGQCLGEKEMDSINDQRHHQLSQEVTFSKADTNWRDASLKCIDVEILQH